MDQTTHGRGCNLVEIKNPSMYIELESSFDDESRKMGARIAFNYQKINTPPSFDLILELDSDQEGDNSKIQSDEPELTLYEKLNRAVKSLTLIALSVDSVSGLVTKDAPYFNGEVRKVHKFFHGSSSSSNEDDVNLDEVYFNELIELSYGQFLIGVKVLISKDLIPSQWTMGQAIYCKNICNLKIRSQMIDFYLTTIELL